MVLLVQPAGCYGAYILNCLYTYSDLTDATEFVFDEVGSSHAINTDTELHQYFDRAHSKRSNFSDFVLVSPDADHYLDYHDNHFVKQIKSNLKHSLAGLFGSSAASYLEHNSKQYDNKMNPNTTHSVAGLFYSSVVDDELDAHWKQDSKAKWAMREFLSFSIQQVLTDGYAKYKDPHAEIYVSDMFNDFTSFYNSICNVAKRLGMNIVVSEVEAIKSHTQFLNLQKYHGIQLRCDKWVDDVIANNDTQCPCKTIYDEAYVQHHLRQKGYEIKCHELDVFPNATNMHKLIYKS